MDSIGVDCGTDERLICSLINRNFWLPNCCEGRTGINCGVVYGCVAMDGGDAEEVRGWVVGGEEDGKDVLCSVNE